MNRWIKIRPNNINIEYVVFLLKVFDVCHCITIKIWCQKRCIFKHKLIYAYPLGLCIW